MSSLRAGSRVEGMHPNQSASPLPRSDDHLSEESLQGVVVPFVNTAAATTSVSDALGNVAIHLPCEPSTERKGAFRSSLSSGGSSAIAVRARTSAPSGSRRSPFDGMPSGRLEHSPLNEFAAAHGARNPYTLGKRRPPMLMVPVCIAGAPENAISTAISNQGLGDWE
jgi:hypothetical protein